MNCPRCQNRLTLAPLPLGSVLVECSACQLRHIAANNMIASRNMANKAGLVVLANQAYTEPDFIETMALVSKRGWRYEHRNGLRYVKLN
mgnify:CR=1 FL=1